MQGITFYFDWEVALMEAIQSSLGITGERIANMCSFLGEEIILILILGFLYWCYDKQMGKRVGFAMVCGLVWNPMIKNLVLRRRPYFDHPGIKCLRPSDPSADIYDIGAQEYSFPSGHSSNSVLAYGGMACYKKKNKILWALAIILPLIVGFSRIVTGNHYPTDVMGGWTLGIITIVVLNFLFDHIKNEKIIYLILILSGIPGFFFCHTTDYFTGMGLLVGAVLAMLFEERFVNFEPTRKPIVCILRILGGGVIYLILNITLKMPFSHEFLYAHNMASFTVRFLRYAITIFLLLGVYPLAFKKIK